jgi:hypothetical protein
MVVALQCPSKASVDKLLPFSIQRLSNFYLYKQSKFIIVLFVETPRKFIAAVINLRGISTNKTIIYLIAMQTYKELIKVNLLLINTALIS